MDVLGLVIAVVVLAANVHDNTAGIALLSQIAENAGVWSTRASRPRSSHTEPASASTWKSSNATRSTRGSSRSRSGGNEWEPLTKGLPQRDCYVNVLRDAMAVDSLDSCGIYFGTTGGQVYGSSDAGDSWNPIVRDLPAVLSVEVQTLP